MESKCVIRRAVVLLAVVVSWIAVGGSRAYGELEQEKMKSGVRFGEMGGTEKDAGQVAVVPTSFSKLGSQPGGLRLHSSEGPGPGSPGRKAAKVAEVAVGTTAGAVGGVLGLGAGLVWTGLVTAVVVGTVFPLIIVLAAIADGKGKEVLKVALSPITWAVQGAKKGYEIGAEAVRNGLG